MQRLSDITAAARAEAHRLTPGRFLCALARGKGDPISAAAWVDGRREWLDSKPISAAITMAATNAYDTANDFSGAIGGPVADAFLNVVRDFSVPMRLEGLRRVPPRTRIYLDSVGVVIGEVAEGFAMPVLRGSWSEVTLAPRKWGGITVHTKELAMATDPGVQVALTTDLAEAVAEAENRAMLHPDVTGSITASAPDFAGTGSTVAAIDADLRRLADHVPGSRRPGAAWAMPRSTAAVLATTRGSGGSRAYPGMTLTGGELLGLPVLVTQGLSDESSPPTSVIVLLAPQEIYYSEDQRVVLQASGDAALEMADDASGDSTGGTDPKNLVSMFQTDSIALKGIKSSAWHARAGSCAVLRPGF